MSTASVSNMSVIQTLTAALQSQKAQLTTLSEQLASSKKYSDLTDYSASEARSLINLQASATQRQAYISVITTVSTNLSIYDTTLSDLEEIATQAQSLANNNPTYSDDVALNVVTQTNSFLKSVTVDLNQQINGRYLYSGTRYDTQPSQDLYSLDPATIPDPADVPTTDPALPSYDHDYVDASSTSPEAYTEDRATIDSGYVIDYGITSNDTAFQQLVAGLRYLQAAGNATDETTYKTYISQASTMLASALTSLQTLHTTVANNISTVTSQKEAQKSAISSLTNQVADIQQVDTTQVSVEITTLEALLQASYSATGTILNMSIVNYL